MADDAPSEFLSRRHQTFPVFSDAEMARTHRFGTVQTHAAGTLASVKRVGGVIGEGAAAVAQIHQVLAGSGAAA
jgi:hypothetical protein